MDAYLAAISSAAKRRACNWCSSIAGVDARTRHPLERRERRGVRGGCSFASLPLLLIRILIPPTWVGACPPLLLRRLGRIAHITAVQTECGEAAAGFACAGRFKGFDRGSAGASPCRITDLAPAPPASGRSSWPARPIDRTARWSAGRVRWRLRGGSCFPCAPSSRSSPRSRSRCACSAR
jgi:hypothetical protein